MLPTSTNGGDVDFSVSALVINGTTGTGSINDTVVSILASVSAGSAAVVKIMKNLKYDILTTTSRKGYVKVIEGGRPVVMLVRVPKKIVFL